MNFAQLNTQWAEQRSKSQDWEIGLFRAAYAFEKAIRSILSPPEDWVDPKGAHKKYLEILSKVDGEYKELSIGNMTITQNGEAKFYVSITFDHGPESYPKVMHTLPIVTRYSNNVVQYDIWDDYNNAPTGKWTQEIDQFSNSVISRYLDSLSHDPMVGYQRPTMGFINLG